MDIDCEPRASMLLLGIEGWVSELQIVALANLGKVVSF